jgi:hypothetical protein
MAGFWSLEFTVGQWASMLMLVGGPLILCRWLSPSIRAYYYGRKLAGGAQRHVHFAAAADSRVAPQVPGYHQSHRV